MSGRLEFQIERSFKFFIYFCGWAVLTPWTLSSAANASNNPSIKIATDVDELFIGESFTLQVTILDVDSPSPPDMRELDADFQYELVSTQPMSSSSVVIINGRMTSQQEFKTVFQYRVTPRRAGRLIIPSLKIVADARELSSGSLAINIIEPEPQEYVIAEVVSNPNSVYPTQSFEVTLRVLVRALPDSDRDPLVPLRRDPPSLSIPWIEAPDGLKGPDDLSKWLGRLKTGRDYGFSINGYRSNDPFDFGFGRPRLALFDLASGEIDQELSDGTTAKFFRYEFTMKFQATRSGLFTFGPALVRGTFVTDSDRREYRGQKIAVTAQSASVRVKEVPAQRPDRFIGGIGRFQARATVSPNRVRVGDPMTLTLDFSCESPEALELVGAPDLRSIESISSDFEIIDHAPVGRIQGSNKLFAYGIRPKAKRAEIPSLIFYSFDPDTEQFIEVETRSIPIEMQESSALAANEIVGRSGEKRIGLKADRSGIFQGTAEMYPLIDDDISITRWAGATGLAWFLSLAGAWVMRARARPSSLSVTQRLSHAKSAARDRLAAARTLIGQGQTSQARVELRQALVGLVAAATEQSSDGFTTQNVLDYLANTGIEPATNTKIRELLESIDASHYGGASQEDLRSMAEKAESLVEPLELALKQNAKAGSRNRSLSTVVVAFAAAFLWCSVQSQATAQTPSSQPALSRPVAQTQSHFNELKAAFEAAIQAMDSAQTPEQFAEAARRLDELESRGLKSGSLHFHAGNAWFRAGQIGRAIRHYRLAKFYLPRDGYLQSNLEQALMMAPGRLSDPSSSSWIDKILFWTHWSSYGNKIRFAALAMMIGAALFFFSVWLKDRRLLAATTLLTIISVAVYSEARRNSPGNYASQNGIVCQETIARKGMGTEYAPAFDRPLRDGAEFEVLQRTSHWTLGRFPGVGDGWISSDSVVGTAF